MTFQRLVFWLCLSVTFCCMWQQLTKLKIFQCTPYYFLLHMVTTHKVEGISVFCYRWQERSRWWSFSTISCCSKSKDVFCTLLSDGDRVQDVAVIFLQVMKFENVSPLFSCCRWWQSRRCCTVIFLLVTKTFHHYFLAGEVQRCFTIIFLVTKFKDVSPLFSCCRWWQSQRCFTLIFLLETSSKMFHPYFLAGDKFKDVSPLFSCCRWWQVQRCFTLIFLLEKFKDVSPSFSCWWQVQRCFILIFLLVTSSKMFHPYFLAADGGKGEEDCKKGAEGAQPSSQEGRGRQSYPRHETQASLLWKTRIRQDWQEIVLCTKASYLEEGANTVSVRLQGIHLGWSTVHATSVNKLDA